ncbi:hypothetical protein NPIL_162351 [Nephila pilipes]|uniref:Uncharacterized protein n=1 Tax=Nephila pilipes TaxID=299642 RepID=A0A8X6NY75_NEPPI|nr:hypothetical protein NPIL_162351 [Nephila pilipes]
MKEEKKLHQDKSSPPLTNMGLDLYGRYPHFQSRPAHRKSGAFQSKLEFHLSSWHTIDNVTFHRYQIDGDSGPSEMRRRWWEWKSSVALPKHYDQNPSKPYVLVSEHFDYPSRLVLRHVEGKYS